NGYRFQPNPCTTCYCTDGKYDCSIIACGWPRCKGNARPSVKKGHCCPSCP
ncbi:cysteine-rich motor neuron 1 protein, partial [Biomphalaria glabrata]